MCASRVEGQERSDVRITSECRAQLRSLVVLLILSDAELDIQLR